MRSTFLALAAVAALAVTADTAEARPGIRGRIAAARARNYYSGGYYRPYYGGYGYARPYYGGYYGYARPRVRVNVGIGSGYGGFMPYYGNYYGGGWRYFRW